VEDGADQARAPVPPAPAVNAVSQLELPALELGAHIATALAAIAALLRELKAELSALGIESVLARNHRLVLRYNAGPLDPSGLTDPQLHIFTAAGKQVATTDGAVFPAGQGSGVPDR
jgi:hypothetical protein